MCGGTLNTAAAGRVAPIALLGVCVVVAGVLVWTLAFGRAKVEGDTPQERMASICRLADEQPWGAGDAIAGAASDADAGVRQCVQVALSSFAGDAAYRSAVEAGLGDAEPMVRAAAATTLGLYADAAAVDRLGEMLSGDPSELARLGAVRGLDRTKRARATWLLAVAMKADKSPVVQCQAIETLMNQLGLQFDIVLDPRDPAGLLKAIRTLEMIPRVRSAIRAAGEQGRDGNKEPRS